MIFTRRESLETLIGRVTASKPVEQIYSRQWNDIFVVINPIIVTKCSNIEKIHKRYMFEVSTSPASLTTL